MNAQTSSATLPGALRQVGHLVTDLDRTLPSWPAPGVGSWYVLRVQRQPPRYRGMPCMVNLTTALANSGDRQIEIIQQENGTPDICTGSIELTGATAGLGEFVRASADGCDGSEPIRKLAVR